MEAYWTGVESGEEDIIINPSFDFTLDNWPTLYKKPPWRTTFPGEYFTESSNSEVEVNRVVRPFGKHKKLHRRLTHGDLTNVRYRKKIIWEELEKYLLDARKQRPFITSREQMLKNSERHHKLFALQRQQFEGLDIVPEYITKRFCHCCCWYTTKNRMRKRLLKETRRRNYPRPKPDRRFFCIKQAPRVKWTIDGWTLDQEIKNANAKVLNVEEYFRVHHKFSHPEHYQSDNEIYHHAMCHVHRTHPMWFEDDDLRIRRRRDERMLRRLAQYQFWNSYRNPAFCQTFVLLLIWVAFIYVFLNIYDVLEISRETPTDKRWFIEQFIYNSTFLRTNEHSPS